ncbi:uncharacterized protein LOC141914982 [Tubulanus polymorphus]|uniref:uncharacterized protein LOC141914982 n=1 Tax=Tubulanus polymorphus TaxID=672921 RepID=UPI003DA668E8
MTFLRRTILVFTKFADGLVLGGDLCTSSSRLTVMTGACMNRTVDRNCRYYSVLSGASIVTRDPLSHPTPSRLWKTKACHLENIMLLQLRYKKRRASRKKISDAEDDVDSDEESDSEAEDNFFIEDQSFNSNFKDVTSHVKSVRADAVISNGLNIARNKVEDYFLSSKLLLNGKRLFKKSQQINVGDYVDLVSEVDENGNKKVKRVRLLSISGDKTMKDKISIRIRAWKTNTVLKNNT